MSIKEKYKETDTHITVCDSYVAIYCLILSTESVMNKKEARLLLRDDIIVGGVIMSVSERRSLGGTAISRPGCR